MAVDAGDGVRAGGDAHRAARVTRCGLAMAFVDGIGRMRAADGVQKGVSSGGRAIVVIASGGAGVSTPSMAR